MFCGLNSSTGFRRLIIVRVSPEDNDVGSIPAIAADNSEVEISIVGVGAYDVRI